MLKGGLLLAALDARRPTRDADLRAEIHGGEADILALVREVAAIRVYDGVMYHTDQASTAPIRDEDRYGGVRVTMPASIGQARLKLALDINIGDPVTPGAVRTAYPALLPGDDFELWTYPIETVLAEKLVTALDRGQTNTRERDWADMWRLTNTHHLAGDELHLAVTRTADHRGVTLVPLSSRLGTLIESRSPAYRTWRRRQNRDADAYPEQFTTVVEQVVAFADPLLTGQAAGRHWQPATRTWTWTRT
jgi:hypothetical protein